MVAGAERIPQLEKVAKEKGITINTTKGVVLATGENRLGGVPLSLHSFKGNRNITEDSM